MVQCISVLSYVEMKVPRGLGIIWVKLDPYFKVCKNSKATS